MVTAIGSSLSLCNWSSSIRPIKPRLYYATDLFSLASPESCKSCWFWRISVANATIKCRQTYRIRMIESQCRQDPRSITCARRKIKKPIAKIYCWWIDNVHKYRSECETFTTMLSVWWVRNIGHLSSRVSKCARNERFCSITNKWASIDVTFQCWQCWTFLADTMINVPTVDVSLEP